MSRRVRRFRTCAGFRTFPIAVVDGICFVLLSRYEREFECGGRHFASAGSPNRGYILTEYDRSILAHGSARIVGRDVDVVFGTSALVAKVQRLVDAGEALPPDRRTIGQAAAGTGCPART